MSTESETTSDFVSVLSQMPDGMGYYYGHYKGSRIDVLPPHNEDDFQWRVFVDGDHVGFRDTKHLAEVYGRQFVDSWGSP